MKFAVPFDYSMHNYLLRYYLAEHGLDPDTDVQIRSVPPPEMVANLRADNIDGFPRARSTISQRAVYDGVASSQPAQGHLGGHPCCSLRASQEFITSIAEHLWRSDTSDRRGDRLRHKAENRKEIAKAIAPANYLNQPPPCWSRS